jgi:hypothetical protein
MLTMPAPSGGHADAERLGRIRAGMAVEDAAVPAEAQHRRVLITGFA